MNTIILHIGDWRVDPASLQISRDRQIARLEPRAMSLLIFLAEQEGEVVSIDSLLQHVWSDAAVTTDSVYQAVTSLRRLMGDDARQPKYIATVARRGYRMVATISWNGSPAEVPQPQVSTGSRLLPSELGNAARSSPHLLVFLLAACAMAGLGVTKWLFRKGDHSPKPAIVGDAQAVPANQSVAVLPFLDLTEGMKQGEFTDGMTEELIDKLSKVPGLKVPSATSSFYFRDKQLPVSDVARKLGVAYVLDGSVRKSGDHVRVAARFVRADTGFVIWSETYDRPWHYTVMVQDDIAAELAKAVNVSLNTDAR